MAKLIVQNNDISIANTPHGKINAGNGITATDAGSGVASFALDQYVPIADNTTSPSAPASGLYLFSRYRTGRRTTSVVGPTRKAKEFQLATWSKKIGWYSCRGSDTTTYTAGMNITATGTATARTFSTASFFYNIRRIGYVSATSAGSAAGIRSATLVMFKGSSASLGGFFFSARFGISQTQTNYRWFVGLAPVTTLLANADPSTMVYMLGFGQDGADSNIQFISTNNTGGILKTDLGASWPRPTAETEFYEARICGVPGDTFYWSIENINPATSRIVEGNTGVSTYVPAATTFLAPHLWINNNAATDAVAMDIEQVYFETDY